MDVDLAEEGKKVGMEFNFNKNQNLPNTFLAHRLLWFTKSKGTQHLMAEALFNAYFTEGRDVGSMDELISIAIEKITSHRAIEKCQVQGIRRKNPGICIHK